MAPTTRRTELFHLRSWTTDEPTERPDLPLGARSCRVEDGRDGCHVGYEAGRSFLRTDPGTNLNGTGYRHQIPLPAWTEPRSASPAVERNATNARGMPMKAHPGGSPPFLLVRISGSSSAFQTTRNQI